MNPEESAAAAAWVAAFAAILFGGTGLALGILGYRRSTQATEAAAAGTLLAKDANAIANGANTLAEEANRIAKESVEIVASADARKVEQHDVRWDGVWREPGTYVMTNVGIHVAEAVVVQVRFQGASATASADRVLPGDDVLVDVPEAKAFFDAKVRASGVRRSPGGVVSITAGPGAYEVEERAFWRTRLGVPRDHSEVRKLPLTTLARRN